MKKTIWMMLGLPGSGKSQWISENLPDVPVVSPDEIRLDVFEVEFDKEFEPYVWATTWREIHLLLDAGVKEIVFDACNVTRFHRAPIFFTYPEVDVMGVWIQTPIEICKTRRPVTETFPADVIDKMNDIFEEPTINEGFKEIRVVKGWDGKKEGKK